MFSNLSLRVKIILVVITILVGLGLFLSFREKLNQILGIKSKDEIIGEQRQVIDTTTNANKNMQITIEELKLIKEVDENITEDYINRKEADKKKIDKKVKKILNDTHQAEKVVKVMLRKKTPDDEVITVNKKQYEVEGYKDIAAIWTAYVLVTGDKK